MAIDIDIDSNSELSILVTGGSGFLGRAIVRALLKLHPQWNVIILDRQPPDDELRSQLAAYIQADITSTNSVDNAFAGLRPDLVVHTAGIVPARELRYSTNKKQWEKVKAINVDGTKNILSATLASGCRRLVFTSSCTVAIDDLEHDYYHMNESVQLGLATLHYGKSKGIAEQYVLSSQHREKGLQACALRPCTIMGPGDTAVISIIHDLITKCESYFIVGDGNNIYDFMYIDNAVHAHVLAIENLLTTETAAGEAFFISNQEPVYFWDFFAFIWAQFGHVPAFRVYIPVQIAWFVALILEIITFFTGSAATLTRASVAEAMRSHYSNNEKAQRILGYYPKVKLADGIRLACDDYKKRLAADANDKKGQKRMA